MQRRDRLWRAQFAIITDTLNKGGQGFGRPGGVCLLTLHWLNAAFMVGILIPNKCAENVVVVFDELYDELGPELFKRLFPVILTDRDTEFSYPSRIEECADGMAASRGERVCRE